MADLPVGRLGGKTLLQYAHKPMMDQLAREGRCGRLVTVPEGFPPGSEVANTAILGYDLNKVYEGRGPLEAASIGYEMADDDMAIRCNIITLENGKIITHNGGNLETQDADVLIKYLNEHLATRSPFRPNSLGLSCVQLDRVEMDSRLGPVIIVKGADLMDGTPIFDIKPYVAYADAHPDARSGFVDTVGWEPLKVIIPSELSALVPASHLDALRATLAQDPRPRYHDDPERVYGMPFLDFDIRFKVSDGTLSVVEIVNN